MAKPGDLASVLAQPQVRSRPGIVGEWDRVNHSLAWHNQAGPTPHHLFMSALALVENIHDRDAEKLSPPWWYMVEEDAKGCAHIGCLVCGASARESLFGWLLDHERTHVIQFETERVAAFEVFVSMRLGKNADIKARTGEVLDCWKEIFGENDLCGQTDA